MFYSEYNLDLWNLQIIVLCFYVDFTVSVFGMRVVYTDATRMD